MTDLDLPSRTGLPDPLRVLLEEFPREIWQTHPQFHGLVSFWLDRHMMFRRLMEHMLTETEGLLDGTREARSFASGISRYGGMLVNQLHGHHQIEDHHYFPLLAKKDPRISKGFEILDKDHHALDGILARFVEGANTAIQGVTAAGRDPKTPVASFQTGLLDLHRLLDRHLQDEEELVVPVILKFGTSGLEG